MNITSPVVFIFFNRPDTTKRVFEVIRKIRPKNIVLVSDGPREHVENEDSVVSQLRIEVEDMIDWPANVTKDYAPKNLGCGVRVSTGIEKALNDFGRAIIVEDDCLPSPSFFRYCETMLDYYENDERITSISGTNFLPQNNKAEDIGFTHFPCIWGWATWKRAWDGYDRELTGWNNSFLDDIHKEGHISVFNLQSWKELFKWIKDNPKSTWDVQFWMLSLKNRGVTIFPYKNQINNIGALPEATHTTRWWFCNKRTFEYKKNTFLIPDTIKIDEKYDRYLQEEFYSNKITFRNIHYRIFVKIKKIFNK